MFVVMLSLFMLTGCSTTRTTRTTTTDPTVEAASTNQETTTVVTEESTTHQSDGGIFGGIFHLVGEVLAFPFRMIAGAFDAIF